MEAIVSKDKSAEKALARELILKKMMARYWNDPEYRYLKKRSEQNTIEGDDELFYL